MYRLALFLWVTSLAAQQNPDLADLNHTVQLHQKGDFAGAIDGYRRFLQKHPEAAQVRSNLGAALAHEGRFDEAIREYTVAVDANPKNAPVRLNLGLAYYKAGRLPEAIEQLEAVHRADPNVRQAVILLADCYLHTGDNKKVIELVDSAGKIDTVDPGLTYLMGMALMRDGQQERAKLWLDNILSRSDSAEAHILLANAKVAANDVAGAREDLLKAIAINPKVAAAHTYLALADMRSGDTASANKEFHLALQLDPNDFDAALQLAGLLRQDQTYTEARQLLMRALALRPGDAAVQYQLASIDLAEDKPEPARVTLEAVVKEAPQFVEAHVTLATVYYRLKRKEDGDREREIVRKLNADAQQQQPGVRQAP